MYAKAKSFIKKYNMSSEYFRCNVGVRQGRGIIYPHFCSPSFSMIFLQFISRSYTGLNISDACYPSLADEHSVLLKVFALLYADDTVVLSENEKELQLVLDSIHEYCTLYNLTVNTSKTKIMVFSRGKVKRYPIFSYGDDIIGVVSDYVFLCVTMNYNNEFVKAMRKQLNQGRKAQFSLLIKCSNPELSKDIQCKLFESMVIPVIVYKLWM